VNQALAISIAALALGGALAPVPAGARRKHMSDITARAAAQLAEFDQDKEPEHLRTAAEALAEVDLSKEKAGLKRLALRRETLHLWLSLLAAIDKNLDPAFNPDDVPAVSVEPPPSGGAQYPPGVDPAVITDPQARQRYEAAIRKNREKAENYNLQTKLRRLDERLMPRAERFVRLSYTTVAGDQRELGETVKKMIANSQRAEALIRAGAPRQK
jgi:hypothetical protein